VDKVLKLVRIQIAVGIMMVIFFCGQSYIFSTSRFQLISKPFASNPEVQQFVYESVQRIWLDMLIWPALFFITLVLSILRLRKDGY
jgi:hypothetical protein